MNMFKKLLSILINIEKEIQPISLQETQNNKKSYPHKQEKIEWEKEKIIHELIEIYKQNDKLTNQQRKISKEDLKKIPIHILEYEYKQEIKKHNQLLEKKQRTLTNKIKIQQTTKSNNPIKYKQNIKKGKNYEKQIGKYFEKQGYIVKYNGIENGKKDNSIDLIAIKKEEIIFIQCKNWKENHKYKITQQMVKAFIGDTYKFIEENPIYKEYQIKRLLVISNKILSKSAYAYIKQNPKIINYQIIKEFPEKINQ